MLIFHFLSVLRTMHCSRTKETIKSRTVKGRKWLSMHAHSSGMFKLCKEIPRLRRLIRGFYELSAAYDLCVQSSTHYLFSLSERCLCFFDSLQCSAVKQVFSREFSKNDDSTRCSDGNDLRPIFIVHAHIHCFFSTSFSLSILWISGIFTTWLCTAKTAMMTAGDNNEYEHYMGQQCERL